MPYVPLIIPAGVPPLAASLLRKLEQQFLHDVHAMFRLPIPNYRLTTDCGFPIAQVLMNAISGASTTLYKHRGKSGPLFKDLLTDYYPWNREPSAPRPRDGAKLLYTVFRNPLTHNLGHHFFPGAPRRVKIKRLRRPDLIRGLTESRIERLEDTSSRPQMSGTITVRPDATVLLVEALYWGTRVMLERLASEPERMRRAEALLQSKGYAA